MFLGKQAQIDADYSFYNKIGLAIAIAIAAAAFYFCYAFIGRHDPGWKKSLDQISNRISDSQRDDWKIISKLESFAGNPFQQKRPNPLQRESSDYEEV